MALKIYLIIISIYMALFLEQFEVHSRIGWEGKGVPVCPVPHTYSASYRPLALMNQR